MSTNKWVLICLWNTNIRHSLNDRSNLTIDDLLSLVIRNFTYKLNSLYKIKYDVNVQKSRSGPLQRQSKQLIWIENKSNMINTEDSILNAVCSFLKYFQCSWYERNNNIHLEVEQSVNTTCFPGYQTFVQNSPVWNQTCP